MLVKCALPVLRVTHQLGIRLCLGRRNQSLDLQEFGKRPSSRGILAMVEIKHKERPRSTKSVEVANNNSSLVVLIVVRRELVQSLKDLVRLGLVVDADTAPDFVDGISLDGELRDDTCSLLVMCLLIDHIGTNRIGYRCLAWQRQARVVRQHRHGQWYRLR